MVEIAGPNAAQIEFWNGEAGRAWTENQERMDRLLEPISAAALDALAPRPGERVLDVGCGCGGTSVAIAASGADVLGVDISAPMLERARARAAGRPRVSFLLADAAAHAFDAEFDALFSRFGVMFFADPTAAFARLRDGLGPDGRLAFVCWQAAFLNPWMAVPGAAARTILPEPPPVDPRAPGPFAFADADYVHGILQGAGYADVDISPFETTLRLGGSVDEALDFTVRVGPLSRLMATAEPDARSRARAAVAAALAPHVADGELRLGARVWIVQARRG